MFGWDMEGEGREEKRKGVEIKEKEGKENTSLGVFGGRWKEKGVKGNMNNNKKNNKLFYHFMLVNYKLIRI